MEQPKILYEFPGGALHEIRPLTQSEADELCDTLGACLSQRTIIQKTINMAFLHLAEHVSRKMSGMSRARAKKQANLLLFMNDPTHLRSLGGVRDLLLMAWLTLGQISVIIAHSRIFVPV
jgi:hypothetical protein